MLTEVYQLVTMGPKNFDCRVKCITKFYIFSPLEKNLKMTIFSTNFLSIVFSSFIFLSEIYHFLI